MENPPWLPDILELNGEWDTIINRLFLIFKRDFHQKRPYFQGSPVWWNNRILPGEKYEEGFWHLITRTDSIKRERLFDIRRAERLPWCNPIITYSHEDKYILIWDYKESKERIRTYLWLKDFDYVIILEKKEKRVGTVAYLITAFYIDGSSSRKKIQRKFNNKI